MACELLRIVIVTILVLWSICCGTKSLEILLPEPIIPEECLDEGYCENVNNYPKEYAAHLIFKLKSKGVDFVKNKYLQRSNFTIEPFKMQLCYTERAKIVTPLAAKDWNGKWHFILNQERNPIQQFVEVKCSNHPSSLSPHKFCHDLLSNAHTHFACRQKYVTIIHIAIGRRGEITSEEIPFPCCCSCDL